MGGYKRDGRAKQTKDNETGDWFLKASKNSEQRLLLFVSLFKIVT